MKQETGAKSKTPSSALQGALVASLFFTYFVILMIFVVLVVHATRGKQKFFVDDPAGNVTEVFPLDEPNVTSSSLLNWVTQAATSVYTLDFYHYQDNINALKDYFTITGYHDFQQSLAASNSLKTIVKDKLIVSAVATDTAVILSEGMMNGVYTWRMQVPLLLNYQGASSSSTQKNIAVSLLVTRVPTNEASKGIGIAQIVDTDIHPTQ